MKIALIYMSPNGATRKTTQLLKEGFQSYGHDVHPVDIGSHHHNFDQIIETIKTCDILGIGSPAYHMDMLKPIQEMIQCITEGTTHHQYQCKAFLYLTYAGITSGKALINTANELSFNKIPIIGALKVHAPHFHHDQPFPTSETINLITDFCTLLEQRKYKPLSSSEVKHLFKPRKWLINILYPIVPLIAKKRTLDIKLMSDQCKGCQKCVRQCPVGAITCEPLNINKESCLYCYHCVITCPFKAITCPIDKLDPMIALNKKVIGTESPSNQILL